MLHAHMLLPQMSFLFVQHPVWCWDFGLIFSSGWMIVVSAYSQHILYRCNFVGFNCSKKLCTAVSHLFISLALSHSDVSCGWAYGSALVIILERISKPQAVSRKLTVLWLIPSLQNHPFHPMWYPRQTFGKPPSIIIIYISFPGLVVGKMAADYPLFHEKHIQNYATTCFDYGI